MVAKSLADAPALRGTGLADAEVPPMSLPLRLPFLAVVIAAIAAPSAARAETVLQPDQLKVEIRLPKDDNPMNAEVVGETDPDYRLQKRFGLARCLCAVAGHAAPSDPRHLDFQFVGHFFLNPEPTSSINEEMQIWFGSGCDTDDTATRATNCGDVQDTVADIDGLPVWRAYPVNDLISPEAPGCPDRDAERLVYGFTDPDANNAFDDKGHASVNVDTRPPPIPDEFTRATGAESAIQLDWELPGSSGDDVIAWQLLCAKQDGAGNWVPAFDNPTDDPQYETSATLCDEPYAVNVATLDVKNDVDAGVPAPAVVPTPLANLDPDYICATSSQTNTTLRVEGLDNGTPYAVVLVSVDKAGNVAAATIDHPLVPALVTDFWEDLNSGNDDVNGGFCLIAETYGDGGGLTGALRAFRDETLAASAPGRALIRAYYRYLSPVGALAHGSVIARVVLAIVLLPLVGIALLWHLLTLPGLLALIAGLVWLRRARRRSRALAPALAGAIALLVAGPARAQSFAPYWADETAVEDSGVDEVRWHVGIKIGPYVPAIDDQFDDRDPYNDMFGDKLSVMPVLEIDRYFLYPGGQLGVFGSIGYFGRKTSALTATGERSSGDKTLFRMLPLAAGLVYRVTSLDDDWGIPVVPYLRGGLAYYLWRVTAPSGSTAWVPVEGCMPSDTVSCDRNRGRGGSLGVQGSAGLAIRAERIDSAAAATMRDSGLYHAGFYAEYQLGWVNDFGRGRKLSVGDNTWFAGIDFEF